jgi:hypothetical protein
MLRIVTESLAKRAAPAAKKSSLKNTGKGLSKEALQLTKQLAKDAKQRETLAAAMPVAPKTTKKELSEIVSKSVADYHQFFESGIASQASLTKAKRPINKTLQVFLNKTQAKSKMPNFKSKVEQVNGLEFEYAGLAPEHAANTKASTKFVPPKTSFGIFYNEATFQAIAKTERINKPVEKLNKNEILKIYKKSVETFQNPPSKSLFEHQKTIAEQVFEKLDSQYKTEMAMVKLEAELKAVKAPKSPFWKWYAANTAALAKEGENLRLKGIQITHHARIKYANLPAVSKTKYEKVYLAEMIAYESVREENALRKVAASGKAVARKPLATLYQQEQRSKLPVRSFKNYEEKKQFDAENIKKFRAEFKKVNKSELARLEKSRGEELIQRKAKVEALRQSMNL